MRYIGDTIIVAIILIALKLIIWYLTANSCAVDIDIQLSLVYAYF